LKNAEPIIERIVKGEALGYDLIEVMACPGGCICGAGHPVPEKIDVLDKRQQVLINIDKKSKYRKSQENPDILRLYQEFYGETNSELAHKLLHTQYRSVNGDIMGKNRRQMSNSVFVTRELVVCTCDLCSKIGSHELYNQITESLKKSKMDAFVQVNTIRFKETHAHAGERIYVTLDGEPVDPDIESICRLIKKK
jgi:formate dehydrogenase major subunit